MNFINDRKIKMGEIIEMEMHRTVTITNNLLQVVQMGNGKYMLIDIYDGNRYVDICIKQDENISSFFNVTTKIKSVKIVKVWEDLKHYMEDLKNG